MAAIGLIFLILIVTGSLLFLLIIRLLTSLQAKLKTDNPQLSKALGYASKGIWGIPIAGFLYQYYADAHYIDTNDMWLMIILYAPLVLLFIVIVLVAANIYTKPRK